MKSRLQEHKEEKVTESWRKLHHYELHNLYSSPNRLRRYNHREWDG
jgi:hypothetical protein